MNRTFSDGQLLKHMHFYWMAKPSPGKYHDLSIVDMHRAMRSEFGDIVRLPGFLGRADTLITFKATIFEKVFRTESQFPRRRGLESFIYYRKNVRPEVFGDTGGLLSEHGEKWLEVRSKVNPVMLQPKVVKMYIDKVDQVVLEFIGKMRTMRHADSLEMPDNFGHELNRWALESVGVIALDERLGVLHDDNHVHGQQIINVSERWRLCVQASPLPNTHTHREFVAFIEIGLGVVHSA